MFCTAGRVGGGSAPGLCYGWSSLSCPCPTGCLRGKGANKQVAASAGCCIWVWVRRGVVCAVLAHLNVSAQAWGVAAAGPAVALEGQALVRGSVSVARVLVCLVGTCFVSALVAGPPPCRASAQVPCSVPSWQHCNTCSVAIEGDAQSTRPEHCPVLPASGGRVVGVLCCLAKCWPPRSSRLMWLCVQHQRLLSQLGCGASIRFFPFMPASSCVVVGAMVVEHLRVD